ncbi:hypothetical protein DMC30DRAFT_56113 [Rhodotorula diobovata]|uniref:Uncharacterized protein n=1 Tax=Rhodotorula diobovata TaxID=5288 RepID=A0A5C5G258_9BASI|nr:hypothetical protein DMC30DRAFT_56113 [Rhodotorula diobovata]
MRLEQIKEELVVLQSSLTQEGEIRMEGDEEWAQWEVPRRRLTSDLLPPTPHPLPSARARRPPRGRVPRRRRAARLLIALLDSGTGGASAAEGRARERGRAGSGRGSRCSPSSPPCKSTSPPTRLRPSLLEPLPPRQRRLEHRKLKTTLLWSHHLLATSKRKDIVAWSTELSLYPGVIIVEGLASNVDEFVHRIKQLQWKALQVRCELGGALIDAQAVEEAGLGVRDAPVWVVRRRSHLGPVLDPKGADKVCVREVEGLNEVGEISMRAAGLEDVFLTALKLNK